MFNRIKKFFKQSKNKTKGLIFRLRLLSRKRDKKANPLMLGEIAYDVDNKKLRVGDGINEAGCAVANVVLGPHDENLYIKIDNLGRYAPLHVLNTYVSIKGHKDV